MLKTAKVEVGNVFNNILVTASKAWLDECRMNPETEMKTKKMGITERIA